MKRLLEVVNRGILKGLNEQNIELFADLDDDNLDQMNSIQAKSINNNVDFSIKYQLIRAIQTGELHNRLKQTANDPKNFHKYKGIVKANGKEHLKQLIEIGQKLFGNDGNFNWIDTSEIIDMSELFYCNYEFNGHIELWDVSNVINMHRMFAKAEKFNQPIGDWDVSNVKYMSEMFYRAYRFNQPIGDWDVSNVKDTTKMFNDAIWFNQPIGNWDVSMVVCMISMFERAEFFNQPIGDWDVSNVENMYNMFGWARRFNQDISHWQINDDCGTADMFIGCQIEEEYKPTIQ